MSKSYTDSVYYSIRLTSRFIKAFMLQVLESLNAEISPDEVFTLDILKSNGSMSQRDLAKMLFRDRSNTGKIALSLKEKGLINIKAEQKNNRLIKELSLTQKGLNLLNSLWESGKPLFDKIQLQFGTNEDVILQNMLLKLRKSLSSVIESQI